MLSEVTMMALTSNCLRCLILMMSICNSPALKVYPSFQQYSDTVEFTSFICTDDHDDYISGDNVEWLYENFTLLTTTSDYRIFVYGDFVTFTPPMSSDAGSYWCRNRTDHSDMAEGKLIFKDDFMAHGEVTILRGSDMTINCSVEQNGTIAWAHLYPNNLISESLKYTISATELIVHNVSADDEGEYACYSEELAIAYAVVNVTVTWSPELITDKTEAVTEVNVGDDVILNCTASGSPDPVYTWLFPDSCSSCPNTSNDSVLIFTAGDVTDSGEYTCVAENTYGNLSVTFNVTVIKKIPPVITKAPTNVKVNLVNNYTNISLTCEADQASSYIWERQNGDIPSDSTGVNSNTLNLINLQPEDAGDYRCVAINDHESSESDYATVTISIAAPEIITDPVDTNAAAPFSAIFHCSVQAYGYLIITWYRNNNNNPLPKKAFTTIIPSVSETTSVLTIPNVTSEDVGTYYCEVWANRRAVQSETANLFLSDPPLPPEVMEIPLVNLTVNNYNLTMKCLPNKNNFNYKWIKKDDVLPSRAQGVDTSQMTIVNLIPKDSGEYQCVMSNSTGTISSNFTTLHVQGSLPRISEQPKDMNISVYESVSFKCTAHGYGVIKLVWKRVEHNMPITAVVTEETSMNEISSILEITSTVGYYSGQYYCIAENEIGTVVSQTATLYVEVPIPEMIISPSNVTILPNHSFTMNCLALSFGALHYNWNKRNGILPQTAVKSYNHNFLLNALSEQTTSTYNLVVHNVQASDEGWYCCVATNEGGSRTDCAWLEVNTLPTITKQPVTNKFKAEDLNVTALRCSAVGIGRIYYRWEKYNSHNNTWMNPSHRAISITNRKLKFNVITEEDEGTYRCIITNDDGSVISDNAIIHVYGPPTVYCINNHTVSVEGDRASMICTAINDADANHSLQVKWYKGDQLLTPNGKRISVHNKNDKTSGQLNSTLILDPVNHSDYGVYSIRAFNDHDSYSESRINLTIQQAPVVYIPNVSPYIINVGSMAALYCIATGRPIPTAQWYKSDTAVTPIPSLFQQAFIVPTDTPHTTVYTCMGTNYAGNRKRVHVSYANITVIVEMSCDPLLKAPKNGKRVVITTNGFVKHISFSCNPTYIMMGTNLVTCNNGTWSSPAPKCMQ